MPALSVRNLSVSFVERTLFSDVSFDVETHDKVGFIGANGVGKTTLFRALNGEIDPNEGVIAFEKSVRVGYMEQHACNNPRMDIFHELLSVFDYLSETEDEIAAVTASIDAGEGNLDALVERQTRRLYNRSFSVKYEILGQPKASSKQPESSELERKMRNYGRIVLFKAEYHAALL